MVNVELWIRKFCSYLDPVFDQLSLKYNVIKAELLADPETFIVSGSSICSFFVGSDPVITSEYDKCLSVRIRTLFFSGGFWADPEPVFYVKKRITCINLTLYVQEVLPIFI